MWTFCVLRPRLNLLRQPPTLPFVNENVISGRYVRFISFPDGDTLLRSSDGVEFRVDSVVLRRNSQFFRDMLQLPPTTSSTQALLEPIRMSEGSYVLNTLLILLYNSSSESIPQPQAPSTSENRIDLLRAREKFNFTCKAIDQFLEAHFATLEPLLSWALAVRFDLREARKAASQRIIEDNVDVLARANDVSELDAVSGRSVTRLHQIQQETAAAWREGLEGVAWTCPLHADEPFTGYMNNMAQTLNLPVEMWNGLAAASVTAYAAGKGCEECFAMALGAAEGMSSRRSKWDEKLVVAVAEEST
ncbi:hypothetical protein DL93DRAFT_289763 [Clavulina sp. PMI_390]|nr:hypothetical protein DL93DRAFT_289763 [Clavulina sp. PMI_390]